MRNIIVSLEIKKYMKQNSQDKIIKKKKATQITYDIYLNLHLLIFSKTEIIIAYEN